MSPPGWTISKGVEDLNISALILPLGDTYLSPVNLKSVSKLGIEKKLYHDSIQGII
jgi:hypothetical protein